MVKIKSQPDASLKSEVFYSVSPALLLRGELKVPVLAKELVKEV